MLLSYCYFCAIVNPLRFETKAPGSTREEPKQINIIIDLIIIIIIIITTI